MVQRANGVASHFASLPREEAIEAVRRHIERFWERDLRDELIAYVSNGGDGLDQVVIDAVDRMEKHA